MNLLKNKYSVINNDIIINNDDVNLSYIGRWNSEANGMINYWQSPYVTFKVKNTSKLKITAFCDKSNGSAGAWCNVFMDDYVFPIVGDTSFDNSASVISGERSAIIQLPCDNKWHTIKLYLFSEITNQFSSISKIWLQKIAIDYGSEIAQSTIGNKKIQVVGDSWFSTAHDYSRLLNQNNYITYPIAGGGMTCSQMEANYLYDKSGTLNTSDTNMDAVVVSFGVNDYLASVTTANFQTKLSSLVDKIRTKQATAKIFLMRVPNNIGASRNYGQYGPNMSTVASSKSNCYYIDSSSLDSLIDWRSDNGHLGVDAKLLMKNLLESQLIANGI